MIWFIDHTELRQAVVNLEMFHDEYVTGLVAAQTFDVFVRTLFPPQMSN